MTTKAIFERLDRVLTYRWLEMYPNINLVSLPIIGSDHARIFLTTCNFRPQNRAGIFKFDAKWLLGPTLFDIIKNIWSIFFHGSHADQLTRKTHLLRHVIKHGEIFTKIH